MHCPRCQHENPPQAKFCLECGARFASACAQCGTHLPAGAKFCVECGSPTDSQGTERPRFGSPRSYIPKHLAEKIVISKSALEGERKQVTILFADMKGSMELLADRDPEEARKLLDPVLELMMDAVHRYEGTVNQVMGDGIMALFGAPIAHEDHAVRAAYAALDMQTALRRYAEKVLRSDGVAVKIRVGLNSGEVVVRAIGSDLRVDYTAVGQTTHLAARMEQLANPGAIFLTAHTVRLAEGYIEVKPLGPVPVKGLDALVEVYEMVAAGPLHSRLHAAAARGLTRFVGRETELERLREALEHAGAGHGQVVAIVGEPGVGKSRLVWEVTHSHRTHGWSIVRASSVSYGNATPYLPLIELLKGYFKIQARDDHRDIREKVMGKLLTLDEALKPGLPALLGLLDVPLEDPEWLALDPPRRRQRTLDMVKRLLLRESQVQPLLAIFEDLHWIDTETQALLDGLVESVPTARVLLLVNYRPEYGHPWSGKTYYTQLRLDPLPPERAEELLQTLLGNDRSLVPLARLLVQRTEGNPFFLEESVRTLAETGVLAGERGAYELAKRLDDIQVPATVQAVLAARIDRLPPEEKALLQTAAVIGKDVPYPLLEAIADLPEDDLRRSLADLQAGEFLYEATLFPDLAYTFKHALTHEVAYGGLLQERRRALHGRVVQAIERLSADRLPEHVEHLAHHAFRGAMWDKAVSYLRQAGARALARSAHREAAARFEQAVEAVERLPRDADTIRISIDLRVDLRTALYPLGEVDRIRHHLHVGERLATEMGDQSRMGRMVAFQAHLAWSAGDPSRAIELAERALALADDTRDLGLRVLATFFLGQACHAHGDYRRGIEVLTTNLEQLPAEMVGERFGMALPASVVTRAWLALCLADVGRFGEAQARADEAVRITRTVAPQPYSDFHSQWAVGGVCALKGDLASAIPALERAVEVARHGNLHLMAAAGMGRLGYAYLLAGRIQEAIAGLEQAVAQGAAHNFSFVGHSHALVLLAEARLRNDEVSEAENLAGRALELCRGRRQRGWEADSLRVLAEIAAHPARLDADKALSHYREALTLAGQLGMRPLVAHCHLGLGRLHQRTGKWDQAQEHLTTATSMYREMEMTYWVEKAEAGLK